MVFKELVSVIIPVFNVQAYLSESIKSVLRQTYSRLEIILVDDGSTDGSTELCDEFAQRDHRIRVIHQSNKGLSAARNTGLNYASGDFIAFLDSDDAIHKDFISSMISTMIIEEADVVICKYTGHDTDEEMIIQGNEKKYPLIREGVYNRVSTLRALADNLINQSVWNKLYRKELWKDLRYPEGHVYEDRYTTYRIFDLCNRVCVLDSALYLHRIRPGSITCTYSRQNVSDWLLSFTQFNSFIAKNIPDIFNTEQLLNNRRSQLYVMITGYTRLSSGGYEKEYRTELRKQIMNLGDDIGADNLGFSTKLQYFMIRLFPHAFIAIYNKYSSFKHMIKKINR